MIFGESECSALCFIEVGVDPDQFIYACFMSIKPCFMVFFIVCLGRIIISLIRLQNQQNGQNEVIIK